MEIPNIFKNRAGAIQLSDLDDNFNVVKVTVNTQETQIATLQTGQQDLVTQIANFSAIPIGCIVLWSGAVNSIPSGWRLCDGTNGTPDLRDRFVVGARADSNGAATTFITGSDTKTGGSKDAVVVNHVHTATSYGSSSATLSNDVDSWDFTIRAQDGATLIPISSSGGVTVTQGYDVGRLTTANNYASNTQVTVARTDTHSHTATVTTNVTTSVNATGDSGTNRNLPPYYSLAYIMKV